MDIEIKPIAIPHELFVDTSGNRLNTTGDLCTPMFLSSDIIAAILDSGTPAPTIHQQGVLVLGDSNGIYWPEMVVYDVLYSHIYAGNFAAWELFEWIAGRLMFARNVVASDAKRIKPEITAVLNSHNNNTHAALEKMRNSFDIGIGEITNKIESMILS